MKHLRSAFILATLLMAVGLFSWWLLGGKGSAEREEPTPAAAPSQRSGGPTTPGVTHHEIAVKSGDSERLSSGQTATTYPEWAAAAHKLPLTEQAAWLIDFLDSGADGATGASFHVGPGGRLIEAPTWRVDALNRLGEVDAASAAAYAAKIFAQSDSPDEWAIALRNYGRHLEHPADDSYFTDRIAELLSRETWLANPSQGFLEAFDAAVYSGRGEWSLVFERLLASRQSERVSRASLMAFESLATHAPAAVAATLAQEAPVSEKVMPLRVSAFARLDPRDADQAQQLEQFVEGLEPDAEPSNYFFRLFPNGNTFAGHFLLSTPPNRSLFEQARIDQAALELVQHWRKEQRFPAHDPQLALLEQRLETHVQGARRGGFL